MWHCGLTLNNFFKHHCIKCDFADADTEMCDQIFASNIVPITFSNVLTKNTFFNQHF